MFERMTKQSVKMCKALWCHRLFYGGIAGVYVGACFGLDPELVKQMLAALYVGLVLKG